MWPKGTEVGQEQAVFGGQGGPCMAGDEALLLIDLKGPSTLTLRFYPFHSGVGDTSR